VSVEENLSVAEGFKRTLRQTAEEILGSLKGMSVFNWIADWSERAYWAASTDICAFCKESRILVKSATKLEEY